MIDPGVERRMLLSIHDVSPKFLGQVDRLHDHLTRSAGPSPIALLVVPDHWREAPIARDAGFKAWLRARHAAGDEILLHGWSHRDETRPRGLLARFKGRHLTAGEGEFLNLDKHEAQARLAAGRAQIEDAIGAAIDGFVAPAWLYGAGAHAALRSEGFGLAEDHLRVWSPATGERLARGPVITWATRTSMRERSSLLAAAALRPLLARASTVRIAVHPGDTGSTPVLDSIARTVRHFRRTHRPGRYRELLIGGERAGRPLTLMPQERA